MQLLEPYFQNYPIFVSKIPIGCTATINQIDRRLLRQSIVFWLSIFTFAVLIGDSRFVVVGNVWANEATPAEVGPQDQPGLGYQVDMSQAITRYVQISLTATAVAEITELMMPTWTPGSYLIREYAKHIDRITANNDKGEPLKIQKISKNRWAVETEPSQNFTVTYRLFCDETSVRTNSVNFNRAVLNGAATFLTIPDQMHRSHTVQLLLPKYWEASSTSLRKTDDGKVAHSYIADDYNELVDSPIVAGNVIEYPFEVAGVPHYLVNVGQSKDWDSAAAIEDITKLVEAHHQLWGEVPYDRYYFITVFGGGGGLEHNNSCLMMTREFDVRDSAAYRSWLRLASHEFFHTWNIRRLRPKELVTYDYENEVYSASLWIAEGITSYYENLLLARAGLIDLDAMVSSLGKKISSTQRSDGRLVQSLRDSSHDAWIKFYRPESNSGDTTISYYTKGAVVGFLLDVEIRARSTGTYSLDDALRRLWNEHKMEIGYAESDFRKICSDLAGTDLSAWFETSVDSTDELDYQKVADWLGMEIGDIQPEANAADHSSSRRRRQTRSADRPRRTPRQRGWIGIGEFDSPATQAGIADTDEVIAINDRRISGSVENVAQDFEIGQPVKVLISRQGQVQEILMIIGSLPATPNWGLKVVTLPSESQKTNLNNWISGCETSSESKFDSSNDAIEASSNDAVVQTDQ